MRLLQHWRHHNFGSIRPFFCQMEAVETTIWLTEVASLSVAGKRILMTTDPDDLVLDLTCGSGTTTYVTE
ncbi:MULTISPECIES: site-specific DNA-methyltransferase [Nitrosomonas]|uniref:site-specific DNA-methyltransferase n=2 Tax=Nitrosomonas TaxID=914 RepID=UPI001CA33607|nr:MULTISPECIES: site-specific DNA-methyltransferase [Nitrosomonas]